jgi:putative transposase
VSRDGIAGTLHLSLRRLPLTLPRFHVHHLRPSAPEAALIMHSDRGSQYASKAPRRLLDKYSMVQSMSRRGNYWDNAAMESFFKTLKVERTNQIQYATRAQARLDIVNWIEGFYNRRRLHSSIGYRSPVSFEQSRMAA